jgi:hypothetical protein
VMIDVFDKGRVAVSGERAGDLGRLEAGGPWF